VTVAVTSAKPLGAVIASASAARRSHSAACPRAAAIQASCASMPAASIAWPPMRAIASPSAA